MKIKQFINDGFNQMKNFIVNYYTSTISFLLGLIGLMVCVFITMSLDNIFFVFLISIFLLSIGIASYAYDKKLESNVLRINDFHRLIDELHENTTIKKDEEWDDISDEMKDIIKK